MERSLPLSPANKPAPLNELGTFRGSDDTQEKWDALVAQRDNWVEQTSRRGYKAVWSTIIWKGTEVVFHVGMERIVPPVVEKKLRSLLSEIEFDTSSIENLTFLLMELAQVLEMDPQTTIGEAFEDPESTKFLIERGRRLLRELSEAIGADRADEERQNPGGSNEPKGV